MSSFCSPIPECSRWDENLSIDRLLFAALAQAVADIRRVHDANHRSGEVDVETQHTKFASWQRGQIAGSAAFVLDFADDWTIPRTVVTLSRKILKIEQPFLEELFAAAAAGMPWEQELVAHCLGCGRPASWRTVIAASPSAPIESAWRYRRPENCTPLCYRCVARLGWQQDPELRMVIAWGLWGPRFEAFWQWHSVFMERRLPPMWDRQADPLWPPEFGGATWETGSGAFRHSEPQLPHGIARTPVQQTVLAQALHVCQPRKNLEVAADVLGPVSGGLPVQSEGHLPELAAPVPRGRLILPPARTSGNLPAAS